MKFILGWNSFLPQKPAHGAYCASEESAGSGVRFSQIGTQRSGSDLNCADMVGTIRTPACLHGAQTAEFEVRIYGR